MKLYLEGHDERYALEQLQMALFPAASMELCDRPFSGDGAVSSLTRGREFLTATGRIRLHGRDVSGVCRLSAGAETVALRRRILQQSYYLAAVQLLERAPAWGALAGVRPTKLTSRVLLHGGSEADCEALLRDVYYVEPARRKLCIDASKATVAAAAQLSPADISLYVGIPFCPSRCVYCSFVSQSTQRHAELLPPFLEALLREIEETGRMLSASPCRIRTVYIGGGTPTTLSSAQLQRLMQAISRHFDLSSCLEYTVEGGRPDTLDAEKLETLRRCGADRISINPQTMQDEVLRRMARRHTAADTVRAVEQARAAGFEHINMDLIAGLPGDSAAGFADSLRRCAALAPANLTVHTLAVKRGSTLHEQGGALPSAETVETMLEDAEKTLRAAGYSPYYLYRQKYMAGSFENVGWCRPGRAGLYNIYMMEELHSILSLGGGGMSKVNLPNGRLERIHNPKYPREYLDRLDHTLEGHRTFFRLLREAPAEDHGT